MKNIKPIAAFLLLAFLSSSPGKLFADNRLPMSKATENENDDWDDRFDDLGVSGVILSTTISGSNLYVGGIITSAGNLPVSNIAKWDGSTWSALGSGADGTVSAIMTDGNDVYIGGDFSTAGEITVNGIAKWNGSSWSSLGTGMNGGDVRAITCSGTDIYAGGIFSNAGGTSVNNIARWNGSSWSALGSGVNAPVFSIAENGGIIYVGGSFTEAGGNAASKVASWDGTSWSNLGPGTNHDVNVVSVQGSVVYAGGLFTLAGGNSAKKVAKWNGSAWSALADGLEGGDVNAITWLGNDLFVGGFFTTAGGSEANRMAKWDGSTWSNLGSGINGPVFALSVLWGDVYAGGSFTTAGGKTSNGIAKWAEGIVTPVELIAFDGTYSQGSVELSWSTVSETENFGFQVERRVRLSNGSGKESFTEWEPVTLVKGSGTTTATVSYRYEDVLSPEITRNTSFDLEYRLRQIDLDGSFDLSAPITVIVQNTHENSIVHQNYPNPFNPSTSIRFTLSRDDHVMLDIFNARGQQIERLLDEDLQAGIAHEVNFDGNGLASGIYYYRLRTSQAREHLFGRMILVK